MMATKKGSGKTWAVFCKYKVDVRNLNLSDAELKDILDADAETAMGKLVSLGLNPKKPTPSKSDWDELYDKAHKAGVEAAEKCIPTPMIVQQHAVPLDDNSPVVKQWHVPQGVCGFAWITVMPGNCSFALYLKKHHDARKGRLSISAYGQCMEKKEAYAHAFAEVVQAAGIKCHSGSRMD